MFIKTNKLIFIKDNQDRIFLTKPLSADFVYKNRDSIKLYNLKWFYLCDKCSSYIIGKLSMLLQWLVNYVEECETMSEGLKYIMPQDKKYKFLKKEFPEGIEKHFGEINNNKEKKNMFFLKKKCSCGCKSKVKVKKQVSLLDKAIALFKSGKKIKIETVAKKLYGSVDELTIKKARRTISDLRIKKGMSIILEGKGIYRL